MQPTFARVELATLDPFIHMNQMARSERLRKLEGTS
jgi:hypothetical protein